MSLSVRHHLEIVAYLVITWPSGKWEIGMEAFPVFFLFRRISKETLFCFKTVVQHLCNAKPITGIRGMFSVLDTERYSLY